MPRPGLNKTRFFYSAVLHVACQLGWPELAWAQGTPWGFLLPLAESRKGSHPHPSGPLLDQEGIEGIKPPVETPRGLPQGQTHCVGRGSPWGGGLLLPPIPLLSLPILQHPSSYSLTLPTNFPPSNPCSHKQSLTVIATCSRIEHLLNAGAMLGLSTHRRMRHSSCSQNSQGTERGACHT